MSFNYYRLLKNLGLSDLRAQQILLGVTTKTFEADEVIWPMGQSEQPWSHILKGIVCASVPSGDAELNPVNIFGPNTWFGEASLLNGRASAVEYICLTPARVVSVRYADALRAFEQDSEFSRYIARLVIWRGQQHAEMLALMRVGSPSLRVVMGLALLTEAIVSNSSHLPRYDLDASLQIPLKQALLASMCGVSRGIFSVCLQQLAASGWLRVDYATVELQSIKTWSKFAHAHRHNRQNHSKTSMQELLILMQKASVHDDELMAFQN